MGLGGSKDKFKLGSKDFLIGRVIGKGAFGKVYCIRDNATEKMYALKVMSKDTVCQKSKTTIQFILQERKILTRLQSPFVVNLLASSQDANKLYLVLDLKLGGDFAYHLPHAGWKEDIVHFYIANLLIALQYLHSCKVIHRDVKPGNILLDEHGYASLTDFNLAVQLGPEGYETRNCGTPLYQAPEVYRREKYDHKADFWSLGVMMYEMMFGRVPWWTSISGGELRKDLHYFEGDLPEHLNVSSDTEKNLTRAILSGKLPPLPSNNKFSAPCISFLNLLCSPASERLQNFQQAQDHEFFAEFNWEDIRLQKTKPPITPKDQANVAVEVTIDAEVFDLERPVSPRASPEAKAKVDWSSWDWMCEDWECEELEEQMRKEEKEKTLRGTGTPTRDGEKNNSPRSTVGLGGLKLSMGKKKKVGKKGGDGEKKGEKEEKKQGQGTKD